MNLADYLKRPIAPDAKSESSWLSWLTLDLASGRLLIADPQFVPSLEDGLIIELPRGSYLIELKMVELDPRRYVSRLRLRKEGTKTKRGRRLGVTWSDTAQTGLCDFERFKSAWIDFETSYEMIRETLETADIHGLAVLNAELGAVMPFVESGLGDGEFPVYELMAGSARVGIEIRFMTLKAAREFAALIPGSGQTQPMPQVDLGSSALVDYAANSVTTGCFIVSETVGLIDISLDASVATYVLRNGPGDDGSGNSDIGARPGGPAAD